MEFKSKIYNSSLSDYVKIEYLILFRKYMNKSILFVGSILLFLTCTIVLFLSLINDSPAKEITFLVIIQLFSLGIALDFDRRVRNIARLIYSEFDNKDFPYSVVVSNEGYRNAEAHELNMVFWSDFNEAILSKRFILLLRDETLVIFDSNNYTDEQFEFITKNIKEKVEKLW